jgi:hypothetical protein
MPCGNKKNMGSKIEGSVLDGPFGNKTDVDICRSNMVKKNISDHCNKAVCPNPAHWVCQAVLAPHLSVENLSLKKKSNRLHCSVYFKKSGWGHSTIYIKNGGRVSDLTGSI